MEKPMNIEHQKVYDDTSLDPKSPASKEQLTEYFKNRYLSEFPVYNDSKKYEVGVFTIINSGKITATVKTRKISTQA